MQKKFAVHDVNHKCRVIMRYALWLPDVFLATYQLWYFHVE